MLILFDFDGTLVNSHDHVIEQFNHLADHYHFKKVTPDMLPQLRELTSQQLIQYFKIPLYKLPKIVLKARRQLAKIVPFFAPVPTLPEILAQLYQEGHQLAIVTSNSKENVIAWLKQNQLEYLFCYIHSEKSYFGKKKALKKALKKLHVSPQEAIYVGDETRDIEAAKANQVHAIAVTWGFNSEKILSVFEPECIVHSPLELLKAVKHLAQT